MVGEFKTIDEQYVILINDMKRVLDDMLDLEYDYNSKIYQKAVDLLDELVDDKPNI